MQGVAGEFGFGVWEPGCGRIHQESEGCERVGGELERGEFGDGFGGGMELRGIPGEDCLLPEEDAVIGVVLGECGGCGREQAECESEREGGVADPVGGG